MMKERWEQALHDPGDWSKHSTTGDGRDSGRFRVVHPFHPLTGREFDLVGCGHTWGEHRVFYR
ncbi:MAG: hypothetical protein HYY01_06420, partial [Chloroflexi bacterium]|nr:hypothetical protein [Chloroflexota bacterium]